MIVFPDSLSLVKTYPDLRKETLAELGLSEKQSKFQKPIFFDNGMRSIHEPQITFYPTWRGFYRLRVDVNIPKMMSGFNVLLPSFEEIREALLIISHNVEQRTGLVFDAFKADVCRVHYAMNWMPEDLDVKKVLRYFSNYALPRFKTSAIKDETVYIQSKKKGFRIYDKHAETLAKCKFAEPIEQSRHIIRIEQFFNDAQSVQRFAKRMKFKNNTSEELLSEKALEAVESQMRDALSLDLLDSANAPDIEQIFQKTNDIKKAINLSGFYNAVKTFGLDFYRDARFKMSKTTYHRNLKECRRLGLSFG